MTGWNENQPPMSLVHGLGQEDNESMTKQRPTQETTTQPSGAYFSAAQYREAMGPGYQIALFREQPTTTGAPTPVRAKPSIARTRTRTRPTRRTRRPALRLRLPRIAIGFRRLVGLRLV